jgi:hypothetical protein
VVKAKQTSNRLPSKLRNHLRGNFEDALNLGTTGSILRGVGCEKARMAYRRLPDLLTMAIPRAKTPK